MDLHYYDKAAIPRVGQPEVGKIYAAQVSSDWHRVKVTEVRGIDCTCWFLDHGDEDLWRTSGRSRPSSWSCHPRP